MTAEFIEEHFAITKISNSRWRFDPKTWVLPTPEHRFYLTFMVAERRFILSRQKVIEPVNVDDAEQIEVFRGMLDVDEIAACMRLAVATPPPEDDTLPF